eukprot:scaffold317_cov260-Pinguiococcus_pyrenoidosus.AAC.11
MTKRTAKDFLLNICQQRSVDKEIHKGLYELCGIKDEESINFGEFVQITCTLAGFETRDILRFCFFVFDKDKNGARLTTEGMRKHASFRGYLDKEELGYIVDSIYDENVPANVAHCLVGLDYDEHGRLYFPEFEMMNRHFPAVLYPVFHMQNCLRESVCGVAWWGRRIARLAQAREEAEETNRDKEEREKKEAEETEETERPSKERRRAIIKRIGCVQYYFNPQKRADMERLYAKGGGMRRQQSRLPGIKTLRSRKGLANLQSSGRGQSAANLFF